MTGKALEEHRALAAERFAPRIQVEELEERLTSLRFEARSGAARVDQAAAEASMILRDQAAAREAFRAQAAAELSEAESIISTRSEIVEKAECEPACKIDPVAG